MASDFTPKDVIVSRTSDGSKVVSEIYSFENWSNLNFFNNFGTLLFVALAIAFGAPLVSFIFFLFYCLRCHITPIPNSYNIFGALASGYLLIDFHYEWYISEVIKIFASSDFVYKMVCFNIALFTTHTLFFVAGEFIAEKLTRNRNYIVSLLLMILCGVYIFFRKQVPFEKLNQKLHFVASNYPTSNSGSTPPVQQFQAIDTTKSSPYNYQSDTVENSGISGNEFSDNQNLSDNLNSNLEAVSIGDQYWSTRNLDVTHFRNGDPIPEAETEEEWREASRMGTPAWCYVKGNSANSTLGKLYNWYAVNDDRGLAPNGWHIPTQSELQQLVILVGVGNSKRLKSTNKWDNCVGTNSLGFSALPTGYRDLYCENEGCFAPFRYSRMLSGCWSSTEFNQNGFLGAISFRINCDGTDSESGFNVSFGSDMTFEHDYKGCGFAVRCVRD